MKRFHILSIIICTLTLAACTKPVPTGTVTLKSGDYTYRGEMRNGKRWGYGVLTLKDSTVYSGQWKDGKRHGQGTATDSLGRKVTGTWNNDTIVSGVAVYPTGTYSGEMNRSYQPHGHGIFKGNDGSYYDGNWADGRRSHFGCGITAEGKVKAGEWRADVFRGERLTYTSERIYGIDISRYQHGKGRKKYPIYWDKVRITNLGTISRKKVRGNVDYKVSFVYIKSTEGATVLNPYYKSDYRGARRNGIRCGTYHFFSTTSPAAKQAYYFLKHSVFSKGDFPPVLDVEPSAAQIKKMGGVQAMFRGIRTWMNIVQQRTGMRPILYVSQQFVNQYLPSAPDIMKNYMVWIARYGEYKPDVRLVFWQLCPDGRVSGIHGEVDINVFNGYLDQYKEFVSTVEKK